MLKIKILSFIAIIFVINLCIFSNITVSFAQEKEVKLTTCDLNKEYKIIGIVFHHVGKPDLTEINDNLKEQAGKMGANCVIGVRYTTYAGYLFGYGTAIKVK